MNQSPQLEIQALYRATGVNSSERYLNNLARKTFLSLWSYPGIYRYQGGGKEICDLLVVFDNHIIIFSDKNCIFPDKGNAADDWRRWYKAAIKESANQIWGAERWIKQHPERIYLDPKCTQRFLWNLPKPEDAIFHRILVVHGATERCKQIRGGSGSLILDSSIIADNHETAPFRIGQLNPKKGFVHVFDDTTLDIILMTLDTTADFINYLVKKEELFQSIGHIEVIGEENLLARYLLAPRNSVGGHDFVLNQKELSKPYRKVNDGLWLDFENSHERISQLDANKLSYQWDRIIEVFNHQLLQNPKQYDLASAERALRFMASEYRLSRRILIDKFFATRDRNRNIYDLRVNAVLSHGIPDLTYIFLFMEKPPNGYEGADYIQLREKYLEAYCILAKLYSPHLKHIVGIATEPEMNSYYLLHLDVSEWSQDDYELAKERYQEYFPKERPTIRRGFEYEYPVTEKQKRGLPRKKGRNELCYCGSGKKHKKCCYLREKGNWQ